MTVTSSDAVDVVELRSRLAEVEETLRAITTAEVEALVIQTSEGPRVFTLEDARDIYRNFVEVMQEGAAALSGAGTIVFANHRLAEMLGRRLDDIFGSPFPSIVSEEDRPYLATTVTSEPVGRCEVRLLPLSGDPIPVQLSWNRLPGGDEARICLVCTDLRALKQAEAGIIAMNVVLEERIEERTSALASANQELEAFSYSISHDLRTPLRAMDGFSKALLNQYGGQLDEQGLHYLSRIRAGAQRMGTMIEELLRLSRLSRADVGLERVDLTELARRVIAGLRETEPERRVDVVIAEGMTCRGDLGLLWIVLDNLLGNAWKFTSGTDHARIEFSQSENGGEAAFAIRDNGVGFDMAHADQLFKPFQRLHSGDAFPGNGIGLVSVQRIIRRHGGQIRAEAKPGHGATFTFTLPANRARS